MYGPAPARPFSGAVGPHISVEAEARRVSGANSGPAPAERPSRDLVGCGKLLKLFLARAGLTQEELAERICYSVESAAASV